MGLIDGGITMGKKMTRRNFLCNVAAVPLLGAYSYADKILVDSKKTAICSKSLSGYEATEVEEKILENIQLLFDESELCAVAKIINIDSYELPGYFPFQISVDCKAFDIFMAVHDISLEFFIDKISQRDQIMKDLKTDSIFLIKGEPIIIKDCPVTLYEPGYKRIEPEHLENQMKKMFKLFEEPRFV